MENTVLIPLAAFAAISLVTFLYLYYGNQKVFKVIKTPSPAVTEREPKPNAIQARANKTFDVLQDNLIKIEGTSDLEKYRDFILVLEGEIRQLALSTAHGSPLKEDRMLQRQIAEYLMLRQRALNQMSLLFDCDLPYLANVARAFKEVEKTSARMVAIPTGFKSIASDVVYRSDFKYITSLLLMMTTPNKDITAAEDYLSGYEGFDWPDSLKALATDWYYSVPDLARIDKYLTTEEHRIRTHHNE